MKKNNYIYPAVFTFEEGQEIAVLFPDFDRTYLWAALEEYARRDRRFGGNTGK